MPEETRMKCECCNTNNKKSRNAKYCDQCSNYICGMLLYRMHRVDSRYKKIWRNMFEKLQNLSGEECFIPKQMREMVQSEGFDINAFQKKPSEKIVQSVE